MQILENYMLYVTRGCSGVKPEQDKKYGLDSLASTPSSELQPYLHSRITCQPGLDYRWCSLQDRRITKSQYEL